MAIDITRFPEFDSWAMNLEALVNVITQAAVQSPVVISAPENVAPPQAEVKKVVQQVTAAVAPVIAPEVPKPVVNNIVNSITTAIVTSPEIIATPENFPAVPQIAQDIASTVIAQEIPELVTLPDRGGPREQVTLPFDGREVQQVPMNAPTVTTAVPPAAPASSVDIDSQIQEIKDRRNKLRDDIKEGNLGPKALENRRENLKEAEATLKELQQEKKDLTATPREPFPSSPSTTQTPTPTPTVTTPTPTTGTRTPTSTRTETPTWYDPTTDNIVIGDPRLGPGQVPAGATIVGGTPPSFTPTETPVTTPVVTTTPAVTATPTSNVVIPSPPVTNIQNPNDVNNNGIPDNVEAAQVAVDAQARAAAEARSLYLQEAAANKKAAIDVLKETIKVYFAQAGDTSFVNELSTIIDDYAKQGYDASTISVLLPQTRPYQVRFSGNQARLAAGMDALSPAEYLSRENQYADILRAYDLEDLATRDTFGNLIGGMVSATELTDRVVNVYDRVRNADPVLKAELDRVRGLSQGAVSDRDFAKALLTGSDGANELKRKIATAEISAEARTRGLEVGSAERLQQLGITREQARAGFETVAQAQPTFEKLTGIYDRELIAPATSQAELEQEVFQGMQSQRRRRLVQQEQAQFAGSSGLASTALSTQRAGQL